MNIPEYNTFVTFDGSKFATAQQAKDAKALIETGSTIDALTIQGDSTTGLHDTLEVCDAIAKAAGNQHLVFGFLDDKNNFIELREAIDYIQQGN